MDGRRSVPADCFNYIIPSDDGCFTASRPHWLYALRDSQRLVVVFSMFSTSPLSSTHPFSFLIHSSRFAFQPLIHYLISPAHALCSFTHAPILFSDPLIHSLLWPTHPFSSPIHSSLPFFHLTHSSLLFYDPLISFLLSPIHPFSSPTHQSILLFHPLISFLMFTHPHINHLLLPTRLYSSLRHSLILCRSLMIGWRKKNLKPWKGAHSNHSVCLSVRLCAGYRAHLLT